MLEMFLLWSEVRNVVVHAGAVIVLRLNKPLSMIGPLIIPYTVKPSKY